MLEGGRVLMKGIHYDDITALFFFLICSVLESYLDPAPSLEEDLSNARAWEEGVTPCPFGGKLWTVRSNARRAA